MRVNSDEETLQAMEAYKRLAATHGTRLWSYREDIGIFSDPLFKETVQTCGQQVSYWRVPDFGGQSLDTGPKFG